jgi:hypothetical protein
MSKIFNSGARGIVGEIVEFMRIFHVSMKDFSDSPIWRKLE